MKTEPESRTTGIAGTVEPSLAVEVRGKVVLFPDSPVMEMEERTTP